MTHNTCQCNSFRLSLTRGAPALATRMSTPPNCSTVQEIRRSTSAFLDTSHLAAAALMSALISCCTALYAGMAKSPGVAGWVSPRPNNSQVSPGAVTGHKPACRNPQMALHTAFSTWACRHQALCLHVQSLGATARFFAGKTFACAASAPCSTVLVNVSDYHTAALLAQADGARQPNSLAPACMPRKHTLTTNTYIVNRPHNPAADVAIAVSQSHVRRTFVGFMQTYLYIYLVPKTLSPNQDAAQGPSAGSKGDFITPIYAQALLLKSVGGVARARVGRERQRTTTCDNCDPASEAL